MEEPMILQTNNAQGGRMETDFYHQNLPQERPQSARSSVLQSGRRTRSARKNSRVDDISSMNQFEGKRSVYKVNDDQLPEPRKIPHQITDNFLRNSNKDPLASLPPEPESGAPIPSIDQNSPGFENPRHLPPKQTNDQQQIGRAHSRQKNDSQLDSMIQEMTGNSRVNTSQDSVEDFLNSRINLTQSKHTNFWLQDLSTSRLSAGQDKQDNKNENNIDNDQALKVKYSERNKERLNKIEKEIQATRKSLSFKSRRSIVYDQGETFGENFDDLDQNLLLGNASPSKSRGDQEKQQRQSPKKSGIREPTRIGSQSNAGRESPGQTSNSSNYSSSVRSMIGKGSKNLLTNNQDNSSEKSLGIKPYTKRSVTKNQEHEDTNQSNEFDQPLKPRDSSFSKLQAPTRVPAAQFHDIPSFLQKHMEGVEAIQETEPNFEQTQGLDFNEIRYDQRDNQNRVETEGIFESPNQFSMDYLLQQNTYRGPVQKYEAAAQLKKQKYSIGLNSARSVGRRRPENFELSNSKANNISQMEQKSKLNKNTFATQNKSMVSNSSKVFTNHSKSVSQFDSKSSALLTKQKVPGLNIKGFSSVLAKPSRNKIATDRSISNMSGGKSVRSARSLFAQPNNSGLNNRNNLTERDLNTKPFAQSKSVMTGKFKQDNRVQSSRLRPVNNESQSEADTSLLNASQQDALNDSISLMSGLGSRMKELVKQSQYRVESFQDFYKSVKSYKNFDHDQHMEQFVEKKESEQAYKQQAVEKNNALFRQSMPSVSLSSDKSHMPLLSSSFSRQNSNKQQSKQQMHSQINLPLKSQRGPKMNLSNKMSSQAPYKKSKSGSGHLQEKQQVYRSDNTVLGAQLLRKAIPSVHSLKPSINPPPMKRQKLPSKYEKYIYQSIKQDLILAFEEIGISYKDQLWSLHEDQSQQENQESDFQAAIFLSKDQMRNVFISLGLLRDFNKMAPKLHQASKMSNLRSSYEQQQQQISNSQQQPCEPEEMEVQVQLLEKSKFDEAWSIVQQDGIVNILSTKVLVLALQGLVQKWMLRASEIPQMPSPSLKKQKSLEEPKAHKKNYSQMELRLLGLTRIQNDQQPQQKLRNQRRKSTNTSFSQVQYDHNKQSIEPNEFSELQACQNHFVLESPKQAEQLKGQFQIFIQNRQSIFPEKFKLNEDDEEEKVERTPGLNHTPSGYLPAPTQSVFGSSNEEFKTPEMCKNFENFHRKNSASYSGQQNQSKKLGQSVSKKAAPLAPSLKNYTPVPTSGRQKNQELYGVKLTGVQPMRQSKAAQKAPEFKVLNNTQNFRPKKNVKEQTVQNEYNQMVRSLKDKSSLPKQNHSSFGKKTPQISKNQRAQDNDGFGNSTPDPFSINKQIQDSEEESHPQLSRTSTLQRNMRKQQETMDLEERTNSQRQESDQVFDEQFSQVFGGDGLRKSLTIEREREALEKAMKRPSLSHLLAESLEVPQGTDLLQNPFLVQQNSRQLGQQQYSNSLGKQQEDVPSSGGDYQIDMNNLAQFDPEKSALMKSTFDSQMSQDRAQAQIQFNDNEKILRQIYEQEKNQAEKEQQENEQVETKKLGQMTQSSPPRDQISQKENTLSSEKRINTDGDQDQDEDPILILDIKLVKDKPEKITIFERDVPEEVVDQFCKEHKLDATKQKRLLSVIQAQIKEYYQEQEEQQEDEDLESDQIQGQRFTSIAQKFGVPESLTQIDENVNETENTQEDEEY